MKVNQRMRVMSDVGVMLEIYLEFNPCYERLIVLACDYDFI